MEMTEDEKKAWKDFVERAKKIDGDIVRGKAIVVFPYLNGILAADAELAALRSGHCKDCCCARSWEALGITESTGKSIVEHIEALCEERDRLRELAGDLALKVCPVCGSETADSNESRLNKENRRLRTMEKWLLEHPNDCFFDVVDGPLFQFTSDDEQRHYDRDATILGAFDKMIRRRAGKGE